MTIVFCIFYLNQFAYIEGSFLAASLHSKVALGTLWHPCSCCWDYASHNLKTAYNQATFLPRPKFTVEN